MPQYTAIATDPAGHIVTLGAFDAPNDQQALLYFGDLVRRQMNAIAPDAVVSLLDPKGIEIGAPSELSEHIKK